MENLNKELEEFKVYLEQEKAQLAQISELLPFYALPFVPSPHVKFEAKLLFK